MNKQDKTRYFSLIGLSALLYVISLMVPAIYCVGFGDGLGFGTAPGFAVLMIGWINVIFTDYYHNPGWFANPCYFISLILAFNTHGTGQQFVVPSRQIENRSRNVVDLDLVFDRYLGGPLKLSFITICIGLSSLLMYLSTEKVAFYIGFYLWIASFVVLYAALFFRRKLNLRHEGEDIQEESQTP